jgi:hypothetical protein
MLRQSGDYMPRARVSERAARARVGRAMLACGETQDDTAMPDRHGLGLIGLIYAAVTATVIGTGLFVVGNSLEGRLTLQPAVVSPHPPIGQ